MSNLVVNIILLLITLIFFWQSFKIKLPNRFSGEITPAFWPRTLLYMLLILTAISAFLAWRKWRIQQHMPSQEDSETADSKANYDAVMAPGNLAAIAVLLALFVFAIPYLGLFFGSVLFLSIFVFAMGQRKVVRAIVISMGLSLVATLAFGYLLRIPLPRGISIFKDLSNLLY